MEPLEHDIDPAGEAGDRIARGAAPAATLPAPGTAAHMTSPLILIADHRGGDPGGRLEELQEADFEVETSTSLRRTLRRIGEARPAAVVLLSLARPGTVELSSLERVRAGEEREEAPIPVLVIAPPADDEAAVRTDRLLHEGLWDIVPEGTSVEEIALRLRRLIGESARALEMKELRHRASHDDRTDLLRPKAFQARLLEHFSAAQRHKYEMALVLIDLDRFGAINKRYDHTVGDVLIEKVGEVIRNALRVEDAAGRLGGDEFGVILPYTAKLDAAGVVNRLRAEIKKLSGEQKGASGPIDVSASIGFETFDGNDLDSLETLRRHAERALRKSKVEGGDKGVYFRNLEE
jgi:diguanylate cyclase (GGDEF)-like protein